MPGPAFLEGERVTLNTIEEEDVPFLQRTINDPRVWSSLAAYEPKNAKQEREWVESVGERGPRLLVCADGEAVGTIGLSDVNDTWGNAEVGYYVAPEHHGNGYATAALGLVCRYAFDELRLHKVYANALTDNPASRRVLEKVGFREEGVHREQAFVGGEYVDVCRYGLLAGEYRG